jgi:hypothetical protein
MRHNKLRMLLLCCTMLLCVGVAMAQDIEPRESHAVRIESDPSGAQVFRGDSLLGNTPLRLLRDAADSLTLYYPDRSAWNAQRVELGSDPLPEHLGVMHVRFTKMVQLRAIPHRAAVYRGDTLLGYTPIDLAADTATLTLHSIGYHSRSVSLATAEGDAMLVMLEALSPPGPPDFAVSTDGMRFPGADILLPAGVSLAAGVAAVMFKQHADARYDAYIDGRDDAMLSEAKKYDIYAGLSLAVLQLGLGYFILRLFEE